MVDLPNEITLYLYSYMDLQSWHSFRQTSKKCNLWARI